MKYVATQNSESLSFLPDKEEGPQPELEVGKRYTLSQGLNCCFLKGDRVEIEQLSNVTGWVRGGDGEKKYTYADKPVRVRLFNSSGDSRIYSANLNILSGKAKVADYDAVNHIQREWFTISEIKIKEE